MTTSGVYLLIYMMIFSLKFEQVELDISYFDGIDDDIDFCTKLAKEECVVIGPGKANCSQVVSDYLVWFLTKSVHLWKFEKFIYFKVIETCLLLRYIHKPSANTF